MNKIIISFGLLGLVGCSDMFLGGVSNGDPVDPKIKEVEKTDTLFVPKDSIVLFLNQSILDTMFNFEYDLEVNRALSLKFKVDPNNEYISSEIVGRAVSEIPLRLSYNGDDMDSLLNQKVELLWSHDFLDTVETGEWIEIQVIPLSAKAYSLNLLSILAIEADSNASLSDVEITSEEFQSVVVDEIIENESFTWKEFNVYEGDSISFKLNSSSELKTYLISESEFSSFVETGIVPVDHIAMFDSLSNDTTLFITSDESLVYLIENKTLDSLNVNDSIKLFKSITF